jgi:hypothetical protein
VIRGDVILRRVVDTAVIIVALCLIVREIQNRDVSVGLSVGLLALAIISCFLLWFESRRAK